MSQNQQLQMKQLSEAQRLKEESAKNSQIIALQKEQEYMKNNNIKEMIRQQKLEAEERKRLVSYLFSYSFFFVGARGETIEPKEPTDKQHP